MFVGHRWLIAAIVLLLLTPLIPGIMIARHVMANAPTTLTDSTNIGGGTSVWSIEHDDHVRTFRVHVPASLSRTHPAPLVVMMHGGFGSGKQAEQSYGWDDLADQQGFIVAYPDGLHRAWNAGSGCCGKPGRDDTDDVGFITAMVTQLQSTLDIDPARIYATGMSNGAILSYRLACETDMFAAIGAVAGNQLVTCANAKPVSVMEIHGAADLMVPLDGSVGAGVAHIDGPPVADTIAFWRQIDMCGEPTTTVDDAVTTATATCADNRSVVLITIDGAGHQWPDSAKIRMGRLLHVDQPSTALNATNTLWQFFSTHSKPIS